MKIEESDLYMRLLNYFWNDYKEENHSQYFNNMIRCSIDSAKERTRIFNWDWRQTTDAFMDSIMGDIKMFDSFANELKEKGLLN